MSRSGEDGASQSGAAGGHDKALEVTFTTAIGRESSDIVSDKSGRSNVFTIPTLSTVYWRCEMRREVDATNPVGQRVLVGRTNPSELVRSVAIMTLCSIAIGSETNLLRFFAGVALDESELDLIRRAAYQDRRALSTEPQEGEAH